MVYLNNLEYSLLKGGQLHIYFKYHNKEDSGCVGSRGRVVKASD